MRAPIKFLLMVLAILPLMVLIFPFWLIRWERMRQVVVSFTYAILAYIIGVRIVRIGKPATHRPLLVISNHSGYADIYALGAAMPIAFTPKSDIRWWPIVGWCCHLSGCVFIERKPSRLPEAQQAIRRALKSGRAICLFAEGTTNDGTHIKPFKSGFFSLAEEDPELLVQPVALRYTHRNGIPLDAAGRAEVAWHGDVTLVPHMMRFLSWRNVTAEVQFLTPVSLSDFASRKELAQHCHRVIAQQLTQIPDQNANVQVG